MATIHLIAVWFSSRISLVKMKKLISVIRALIYNSGRSLYCEKCSDFTGLYAVL